MTDHQNSQQLDVVKTRMLVVIRMMLVTDVCNLPDCRGAAVSGSLAQTICVMMKNPEPGYIIMPCAAVVMSAVR